MDGIGISFDFSQFNNKLDELGRAVFDAVKKGVYLGGEALRADSVAIVPFDHGFSGGLAGSASTQLPVDEGGGVISSTVGYNMPYAARLHEDLTLHIKQTHAGNGGARQQKYLEKPAKENAEKYGKIIHENVTASLS